MFAFLAPLLHHVNTWVIKLGILVAVDVVFRAFFTDHLTGLKTFFIYMENIALFKLFNEHTVVFILNMMVLVMSYEVIIWIVGKHHLRSPHHNVNVHS